MSRIFITGSTDGLGHLAAEVLMSEGHEVVLHARTRERASVLSDLAPGAAGAVIGDLSSTAETRELADQVNDFGRMDAVIHNAGVYLEPSRSTTADGHPKTLAVNTLAPYLLTALIRRPDRLIYLSSGLHHAGTGSLGDIDWTRRRWNAAQAYAESKLHVIALVLTLARVAGRTQQRRRSGLGPDQDGRSWRDRRPGAGIPHANVARRQQRRSRGRERRLLVPPAAAGTRTRGRRSGLPGQSDGPAGHAYRCRALLTTAGG